MTEFTPKNWFRPRNDISARLAYDLNDLEQRISAGIVAAGPSGTNGAGWLFGSGAPSAGTGSNGDAYVDTDSAN